MAGDTTRSEQVIEDFKKRKLAASALRKIHAIINGFEKQREADARIARVGIVCLLILLGLALYFFLGGERITLS